MADRAPQLELRSAPHLRPPYSVETIMRNVVYAILPITLFAVFQFGISALTLIVTVVLACLLTERFFNWTAERDNTLGDYSATITGLLLALTLPPGFPLWMGAVAGFIAIALGKVLFGGLGLNVFNPALVGRAFVQAAFPVAITTWTPSLLKDRFVEFIPTSLTAPFMAPSSLDAFCRDNAIDTCSGVTPLALHKFEGVLTDPSSLFTGMTSGSSGETSAVLILLCGLYLAYRRMMDWRIPVAIMVSAALTTWAIRLIGGDGYPDAWFMLFSGGLMLGAVFMATDMVGSPVTPMGVVIYGAIIGFVTVIIRLFGGLNEGVMYAILLGNALTPIIDAYTQPRVYGINKGKAGS